MRLVAWNTNYNNQRRSLEETVKRLEPLHADVLVLSEVAKPESNKPLNAQWFVGSSPGLAVIVRPGLNLTAHPANDGAPPITAGFEVSGDIRFNLVAAWPVKNTGGASYHKVLMAAIERYSTMLGSAPAVLAGDLNSSSRVREQRLSHSVFVERVRHLGLESAYHFQTGEVYGEETVATYLHSSGKTKGFHLDYCFVSSSLANGSTLSVLRGDKWSRLSDHYPIVLDVPDGALN